MTEAREFTFQDYLGIASRRKWLIVGCILLSLTIALALCLILPRSYISSTLIIVESQKVPEDYVKGVVTGTVEDRLEMIQQMLRSRTLLTRVIEMFNLYEEDRGKGLEHRIGRMRKNIAIDKTKNNQAFTLSFEHEIPITAQKVTATLADILIKENLSTREQLVEGANEFLASELTGAKQELEAREKAISEFKRAYMGELPQQMEANLRTLDRLQVEGFTQNETLSSLNARLGVIEKAIKEYEITGTPSMELPASTRKTGHRLSRLTELERKLATLSMTYKPNYPDIVQLKEEIAGLKAEPPANDDELTDDLLGQERKSVGPRPADPYLRELNRQRGEVKVEIASVKERLSRLSGQIKDYEGRVERAPTREQKLMVLVRDYENMQKNYQALLEKKLNARIAENLERRQKGEQFRVIDPANTPEKPEKPNKPLILLGGLLIGCGLGFGMAVLLEQIAKSFNYPEEAEIFLGLPLLAAIPSFQTAFAHSGKFLPLTTEGPPSSPPVRSKGLLQYRGKGPNQEARPENGRAVQRGFSPELNLVAKWRPMSVVAEQFRVAATKLTLMSAEREHTVVVVTSAVMGEGKSSTAANLGYVLAQDLGKATLLMDCDFKRPVLHAYAGAEPEPGLAKVLHKDHPLEDCLQKLGDLPLWILPAGSTARRPVELSKMNQLSAILSTLRSRFDYIIMDAPPILPLADMNVLASMADIMALVVRAGTTGRDVVKNALKALRIPNQAGIVLTGLQADWTPYYMQQEYYLGSDAEKHL
ncbi:MAG: hypothetical protein E6K61_00090 [Nitrospirae bacterium]|nr:MAG: hypothetical protein AUI03_04745 [Nitrospirae bacterium 13_2_20CM_2_62_8]TLY44708.1 MAG: hypothetical protein E6K61_00090 [Nitrospirota bacterium]